MATGNVRQKAVETASLGADEIANIRETLLIGLECFGEVERLIDSFDMLKSIGHSPDSSLRAKHPTGAADTVCMFAAALRSLEGLEVSHA